MELVYLPGEARTIAFIAAATFTAAFGSLDFGESSESSSGQLAAAGSARRLPDCSSLMPAIVA